jgi:hypothetical protein
MMDGMLDPGHYGHCEAGAAGPWSGRVVLGLAGRGCSRQGTALIEGCQALLGGLLALR